VTKSLTSSGFGICGAVIARKDLVTNIDDDQLKGIFPSRSNTCRTATSAPTSTPAGGHGLNDMRTIRSKMDLMSRSSEKVAAYLADHPGVESVQYLGLKNHPLHDLASRYMWLVDAEYDDQYQRPVNRYGHLMSFCVKGGAKKRERSSTACSASGGPPISAGSRAWPPFRRSPPTSSRARPAGRLPASPPT
jgi:hypothetical protein